MSMWKRDFFKFQLEKDKIKNVHVILLVPLLLIVIGKALHDFFYVAIGKAATNEALLSVKGYGTSSHLETFRWFFLLILIYALVLAWYSPIWKFIKTRDPVLKDVVRRRISGIYKAAFMLCGILVLSTLALHLITYWKALVFRDFLLYNLPPIFLAFMVQLGIVYVLLENMLAGSVGSLMEQLYTQNELYKIRKAFCISLMTKISILIFSAVIVPAAMVYIYIRVVHGVTGYQLEKLNSMLIYCSALPLFYVMAVVLGSLQKPVNGLIDKMRRLAAGDFNVKTRIYFTDEIAQIKSNFNVMVDQLKEREQLKDTFGKYVSVEVAKQLLGSGKIDLGGNEIEATVLFCDIRNFTPMSERMTPKEVVDFLNSYFSYVTGPIMDNNGIINKFMGDAVLAIYTPGLGSEDHVCDALRSAISMRKALESFNSSGKAPGNVRFGIGIQTGKLVAGNIGTLARLEYTVIGDTVNVASRLETTTKEVGTDILLSKEVYDRVNDLFKDTVTFEEVGPVSLKGKTGQMVLYQISPT